MSFLAICLLAVALAMDATAVSIARGAAAPRFRVADALVAAVFFGGFQALMPVLGWLLGSRFAEHVEAWDHWIAFVLLAAVGLKMIYDARTPDEQATPDAREPPSFDMRVMLALAIATSIDAFAVGITLPLMDAPLILSVTTIGIVTAAFSAAGVAAGRRLGAMFGKRLDIVGGVILVLLGAKILAQHLMGR